tara:strand:+ start:179 stop:325 length:147 start_codon:yes stop_codon:yes gene_type:complete
MAAKKKEVKKVDTTKEDIVTLQEIVIGLSSRIKELENLYNKVRNRLGI